MTFDNKIDIANLIVQAFIGIVTFVTLLVALSQSNQSKRNREDDIKRYQSSRISAWYEGGRNRADRPEDNRFVWRFVVLRNESESPVYDVIVTSSELVEPAPLSKERTTFPLFPAASASARFLLEHGAYGSRRKGPEWECARHPKRLSPTQTELRGFGGATESSRRSLWSQPGSTGCLSP